jgi:CHAT domain-containing protein/tetratricopeptide (TPR) repeat protein
VTGGGTHFRPAHTLSRLNCFWVAAAVWTAVAVTAWPQSANRGPLLKDGNDIERGIRAGETHSFPVHLTAGQFFHAVVDQKGADVRVSLTGPDGREVAQSDFPNADWGPEVVAVVAELTGDYALAVAQPDAKAAPGSYELHVMALRDAGPADRERAAAETSVGNAERLRHISTAASQAEAIAAYEKALPFFERSGERYRQALILNSAGLIYARSGDMQRALERYGPAIQLFHDLGDQRREGPVLNNAAGAYDVLGDLPRAHQYYQRALELFRAVGSRQEEANTLSNIGKLYSDQAEWQKAIEYYREALRLIQAAGATRFEATVLGNLGTAYIYLGEYDTARDYLVRAIERSRASGDQRGQAPALISLGADYLMQDRIPEALGDLEQALSLYRTRGDRRNEGISLNYIGVSHARLGETAKALEALGQAVEMLSVAGDRRDEAIALSNTGRVYADAGQAARALEYSTQALTAFRAIGDGNNEARTQLAIAGVQRNLGNLVEARRNAEESLSLIEQVRRGTGADQTRASYLAARQDAYAFTIDLLMELHRRETDAGLDAAALNTSERARARSLLEMLAESGAEIRQGVDPKLLDREREISNLLNVNGARLLPLLGRETPQAAALREQVRTLETEYQDVEAAIRESSPRYAALTQPSPLKATQIQRQLLDEDSLLLEYSLGEKRSFVWAISRTRLDAFELPAREKIEAQTTRVYELLTARSVYRRAEAPAERLARIAQADASLAEAFRELSEMILGPAAAVLGNKRLVVVPDGGLQRLPFSALPAPGGGEPLIVKHEIVVAPSASAIFVLRNEIAGRPHASKMLAVFADPVFDSSDPRAGRSAAATPAVPPEASRILQHVAEPGSNASTKLNISRLPFTLQEADQILGVAGGASNWKAVGFDASRAAATSGKLGDYRYLHFATHGYLDTERPSLSALVLSQVDAKGHPEDGFLRVNDIYNAQLSADLAVLSACQTGLGKEVRGEGLMGLTRAFLYAGVPRVIVSLWNVNDRATADLMASLYRGMLREGKSPAAALRQAQLELRKKKRYESPFYWAAFVQQGEWQ